MPDLIRTVHAQSPTGRADRFRIACRCIKQAGGIDGDVIRREFTRLAARAGLRPGVTPKALRHHFATALERAGVPYYTRKYLMGHRLGATSGQRADIGAIYTHLDAEHVKRVYQQVLDGPLAAPLAAFTARLNELVGGEK